MGQGLRWPYPSPRRGQLEVADAVRRGVEAGEAVAVNAPTGFGKTAAVIYGLLRAGVERVVYLVRTRNEIVPVLRELRRFGVEDYVFLYSARRMCPLLGGEGLSSDDFWENCRLLRLRGECSYYRGLERVDSEFVRAIVSRAHTPFEAVRLLGGSGVCPFFALKLLVGESRFIVATYPYVFRKDIFLSVLEPLDYKDFVLVVDEAHSLLQAQSIVEVRVRLWEVRAAAAEVEEYGLPGELGERLRELEEIIAEAPAGEEARRAPLGRLRRILEEPDLWADAAEEVRLEKLRRALDSGAAPRITVALAKIAEAARAVASEGYSAYRVRERGRVPALVVTPVEPCVVTEEPLNSSRAAVLVSGTLPPAKYLREVLCIHRPLRVYDVELLHGPVTPPASRFVVVTAELTSRYSFRSPSMYRRYAEYIAATFHSVRGSVMAVYPSYEFMSSIVAALKPLLRGATVVTEDRGTDYDSVAATVAEKRRVLINAVAGGKLTEGVEFVDEAGRSLVSTIFVAGVPYPQPDDYFRDQLEALAKRLGADEARRYMFDVTASVKVRQAVGRAQRSPEDRALIVLGDARFLRRSLRQLLRLPVNHVAYSLSDYTDAVRGAAEKLGV